MNETRYFIFNHESAFADCRLDNCSWSGGAVTPNGVCAYSLATPVLDCGSRGNVWQRVLADVSLPSGATLSWRLYAGERESAIGASAPFTAENTHDFIPIGVRGRYALLEAEMSGGAQIRSIQVFSEWESFLDYLPEIYRDYNGFSDRFLRLFAAQYLELERKIGEISEMFDPAVAPEHALRRLAGLAGVPHAGLWESEGLRRLLTSGVYKRRGEFSVFADYIEYFTGHRPYVAENFRHITGKPEHDALYLNGDVTVFLPPEAGAALDIDALDTVIADFLPEDLVWRVSLLNKSPVVSGYAYLGINTAVGSYADASVGNSRIGFSVVGGAE